MLEPNHFWNYGTKEPTLKIFPKREEEQAIEALAVITLGGIDYPVIEVENLELDGLTPAYGMIGYQYPLIQIRKNIDPQQKALALLHEITHAIFAQYGLGETDEETVHTVAKGFVEVLRYHDLMGIFKALGVDWDEITEEENNEQA